MKKLVAALACALALTACSSTPTPVAPVVSEFDAQSYLGKWYEIIRLPHSFEEGLESVSAEYRLNADNSIEVTNRGYHVRDGEWQTAIGHAVPVDKAMYRVTFFWPFDGGYYVSWLQTDEQGNYEVAMVTSDSHDYFWLLARTPTIPEETIEEIKVRAKAWGFETDRMIRVDHTAGSN